MDHLIHDGLHLWAPGVQRANTHFGHRQQDERGGRSGVGAPSHQAEEEEEERT